MTLLPEIFLHRVRALSDREALGERGPGGWSFETWAELGERAIAVAAALTARGLRPGDAAAIVSSTRRAWVEAEIGILLAGGVVVPIHPETPEAAAHDIARRASVRFALVEDPLQAEKLLGLLEPLGGISRLVVFDPLCRLAGADARGRIEVSLSDLAVPAGASPPEMLSSFLDLGRSEVRRGAGSAVERQASRLRAEDPATVVFNWSSAGRPMATVLTHDNLAFTTAALGNELGVTPADRTLLFLPLAHVYPRLVVWTSWHVGFSVAFTKPRGNVPADAEAVRPDFMAVVPRFLDKIRRGFLAEAAREPRWRRALVAWAFDAGRRRGALAEGTSPSLLLEAEHAAADRFLFRGLRARFGGRLRFLISGGAPLPVESARFFSDTGIPVVEGYGLTETTALVSFNRPERSRLGTVGHPIPSTEVRIADDGEILVRGRNVMRGFLDDPEATARMLGADGWLRSGDIGKIDPDGHLRITGRKKDVVVTDGGKNVAPGHIEEFLRAHPLVADALVIGDDRPHLIALLALDADEVRRVAAAAGLVVASVEAADRHPAIRVPLDELVSACNRRLDRFHHVRRIGLVADLDAGGRTGRDRRRILEERHRVLIDRLYGSEQRTE
jgi:long-chain acyl-CoA synthetase